MFDLRDYQFFWNIGIPRLSLQTFAHDHVGTNFQQFNEQLTLMNDLVYDANVE